MNSYVVTLGTRVELVHAANEGDARARVSRRWTAANKGVKERERRRDRPTVDEIRVRPATRQDIALLDHAGGSETQRQAWSRGLGV